MVKHEWIEDLQKILHKYNLFVQFFETALDLTVSDEYKVVIRADERPTGEQNNIEEYPLKV